VEEEAVSQASEDQHTFTVSYRMSVKLHLVRYSLAYFHLTFPFFQPGPKS